MLGHALGAAARAARQLGARAHGVLEDRLAHLLLGPARVGEHARVLGRDDQEHVEEERELRVHHRLDRAAIERASESRLARELIDDDVRAVGRRRA